MGKTDNQQTMSDSEQKQQVPLLDQIKNQMLKAWQPVPSLTKTIIIFFILSGIFLGFGIPMKILQTNIQQSRIRYDNECLLQTQCIVTLNIAKEMVDPIFVYYQLDGFYQNHRMYANSISNEQLKGDNISNSSAQSDCHPISLNKDLHVTQSINNLTLSPYEIANPCGLIASTVFNDSFQLYNNTLIFAIQSTGIAWPSDKKKFKVTNESTMWYNVSQERFMNWVRIASMPNFRKLWGRIQTTLSPGQYTVKIQNNYNVSKLGTKKYFVLSQSNFFGSKNDFLSITYIVAGTISFLISFIFFITKIIRRKRRTN